MAEIRIVELIETSKEGMPAPQGEPTVHKEPELEPRIRSGASSELAQQEPSTLFARNSFFSMGRLFASATVALVLPAYLTHKLPVATYSAWVLILQMSAYVSYLDLGIQTGISKYVAEFEARKDPIGSSIRASAGLALMLCASGLGILLTLVLAWYVPEIFHEMPRALYGDVRVSLIFVGISLSVGLLCSTFSAVFFGLQRYAVPMVISVTNRILFTAVVLMAVYCRSSLTVIGALVATVNIVTGLLQVEAWRRFARRVHLSLRGLDFSIVREMLSYCSTLAIWSAGMLCVSGLDITIVGHYDFGQTSFYSIATLPTSFAMSIMGAALAPLLPTASALGVQRTPLQMGEILCRVTRYSTIFLFASGLPLLVAGYFILRIWVGQDYASHTLPYLRILVIANMLRNACMPYASMLVATNSQRFAIAGAVAEAIVNLSSSLYLVRHIGAIGVAYGTLIGSVVSVGMHFAVSMHYTYPKLRASRPHLLLAGFGRPALIAVPSLLLMRLWWRAAEPAFTPILWVLWAVSTLLAGWYVSLTGDERSRIVEVLSARLRLRSS
jgi:O-antigen/teichoic acid export membrane protein